MALVSVRFIRPFKTSGGPLYVAGDVAALSETMAHEAMRQGVALLVPALEHREAGLDGPPRHKQVKTHVRTKG